MIFDVISIADDFTCIRKGGIELQLHLLCFLDVYINSSSDVSDHLVTLIFFSVKLGDLCVFPDWRARI